MVWAKEEAQRRAPPIFKGCHSGEAANIAPKARFWEIAFVGGGRVMVSMAKRGLTTMMPFFNSIPHVKVILDVEFWGHKGRGHSKSRGAIQ